VLYSIFQKHRLVADEDLPPPPPELMEKAAHPDQRDDYIRPTAISALSNALPLKMMLPPEEDFETDEAEVGFFHLSGGLHFTFLSNFSQVVQKSVTKIIWR
jgi:hypothetical protein